MVDTRAYSESTPFGMINAGSTRFEVWGEAKAWYSHAVAVIKAAAWAINWRQSNAINAVKPEEIVVEIVNYIYQKEKCHMGHKIDVNYCRVEDGDCALYDKIGTISKVLGVALSRLSFLFGQLRYNFICRGRESYPEMFLSIIERYCDGSLYWDGYNEQR